MCFLLFLQVQGLLIGFPQISNCWFGNRGRLYGLDLLYFHQFLTSQFPSIGQTNSGVGSYILFLPLSTNSALNIPTNPGLSDSDTKLTRRAELSTVGKGFLVTLVF